MVIQLFSLLGPFHQNIQARLDSATKRLATAKTDAEKFYALNDAAKQSFVVGHTKDARKYATELLAQLPKYQGDWNYGNAMQDGNLACFGKGE